MLCPSWRPGAANGASHLAQHCPPILETTSDSWDDLARAYIRLTAMYGECAARHRATVEAWPR